MNSKVNDRLRVLNRAGKLHPIRRTGPLKTGSLFGSKTLRFGTPIERSAAALGGPGGERYGDGGGRSISELVMNMRAFGPAPSPATIERAAPTGPPAETEMLPFRHSQPLIEPSGSATEDAAGAAPLRGPDAVISCSEKSPS